MCIVIDANVLSMVFEAENQKHVDFKSIKIWIHKRQGFLIYGGKKYKEELAANYRKLFNTLRDAGMAIPINDRVIEDAEKRIVNATKGTDCNDQHIIALLSCSGCWLLASLDRKAYPHFRNRGLYPPNMPKVRIYSSARNANLLVRCDPHKIRNSEACLAVA